MAATFNDILKAINAAVDEFNSTVPASQQNMLSAIQAEIKDLDLTPGKDIKISVKNLKLAGKIKAQLGDLIMTDKYLGTVQTFVDSFTAVAQLQNEYWNSIEAEFKPGPLLEEIKKQNVADTVDTLTENGISAQISEALTDIINSNITTGGSYAQLTEQLRAALTDQDGNLGLLSRYARTYTTDTINTFAAQYNQTISDDLGYEWYAYQGSDIQTTRPFCDAMTDFTFFHKSEIPRLLKAQGLYYTNKKTGQRELVPIYEKTGLPQGMKANTTPANFLNLRGGWNCGHQIRPVSEKIVPQVDKDRVAASGAIPFTAPPKKETPAEEKPKTLTEAIKDMENYKPTPAQAAAVLDYSSSGYGSINRYLRKGINPTIEKRTQVEFIKEFLKNAPKGSGTTYRGMMLGEENYNTLLAAAKNGDSFMDKGFMSTSMDSDEATTFRRSSIYSAKLEIQGKTGVPISRFSDSPKEQEVLFAPGTVFEPVEWHEVGNDDQKILYLTLKEK